MLDAWIVVPVPDIKATGDPIPSPTNFVPFGRYQVDEIGIVPAGNKTTAGGRAFVAHHGLFAHVKGVPPMGAAQKC